MKKFLTKLLRVIATVLYTLNRSLVHLCRYTDKALEKYSYTKLGVISHKDLKTSQSIHEELIERIIKSLDKRDKGRAEDLKKTLQDVAENVAIQGDVVSEEFKKNSKKVDGLVNFLKGHRKPKK